MVVDSFGPPFIWIYLLLLLFQINQNINGDGGSKLSTTIYTNIDLPLLLLQINHHINGGGGSKLSTTIYTNIGLPLLFQINHNIKGGCSQI